METHWLYKEHWNFRFHNILIKPCSYFHCKILLRCLCVHYNSDLFSEIFAHVIFFLKVHFRTIIPLIWNPDKWMPFLRAFQILRNTNLLSFLQFLLDVFSRKRVWHRVYFIDRKKTSHDIITLNFDCITMQSNLHYNTQWEPIIY